MTVTAVMSALPVAPPPPLLPVTVITAVAEMLPVNPFIDAVIVVVPAETAVATPDELIVATAGALELQATTLVTSVDEEGCLP